jgi:hypothetical protein
MTYPTRCHPQDMEAKARKSMKLKAAFALSTILLGAAGPEVASSAVTEPVVVIGPSGLTLKGTATGSLSGVKFTATNGTLTCGGSYAGWISSPTITTQVLCSDGRKGIVIARRERIGIAGHGTVRLNDGSEWIFMFGPAAANFQDAQ